ncbi:aromatic ring-hydroxylating dioxygenase subunit alpha [Alphaproteobacteria bacterium LSUCC0684]
MPLDAEKTSLLQSIARDTSRAPHSMPGWYYADPDFFALEKQTVFRTGWVAAGHQSEITKPGEYFTLVIGDEPVVVLRDKDGKLRAFSNVCRHRGMQLVEGKGRAPVLTCPYHAWSYALDGSLNKAPYMDQVPDFDAAGCSLPEFRLDQWLGFIFINIDGNAPDLGAEMAGMMPFLENYRPQDRHSTETWVETWQTNWKSLVENFMEGYHLSVTHAETLDHITPTRLCEKLGNGSRYTAYRSNYDDSFPQRKPYPEGLTAKERRSSVLFSVYPNFVITVGPNCAIFLILLPDTPESVNIRMGVLVQDGADDLQATRDYISLAHEFNAEDKAVLEIMQKSTGTAYRPMAPLGPADLEGTIWDFTRHIASSVSA